ncbi:MAG: acyltransferase [Acidobacteriales bacterium]|nr:acyltransferase [Terriglobales bacterium]
MKPNNFDLARLLLASIVIYFHCHALSGSAALQPLSVFSGHLAVECFFVISGFLIFASYERSKGLKDYYAKRARRILPGYWFATLLSLGIVLYFTHALHVGKYLLANLSFLTFLAPGVPGVFEHNPGNASMNGSLWTIKIEVMFYIAVPLLVWMCRRFGRLQTLVPIAVASVVYRVLLAKSHPTLALQLPGQMSFFCGGAITYYYLPEFKRYGRWLVAPAILAYIVHAYFGVFFLRPFALTVLVLAFSLLLPEIKGPTRWGDFSYGVYVLHYPIIQTLIALGLFERAPWAAVALVTALVACVSVLSWYAVERRWLSSRAHPPSELRRMEEGARAAAVSS